MKNKYFTKLLHGPPDNIGTSIHLHGFSNSEKGTNTSEGCEYLDNNIRMKEQPYSNTETLNEWKSTIYILII